MKLRCRPVTLALVLAAATSVPASAQQTFTSGPPTSAQAAPGASAGDSRGLPGATSGAGAHSSATGESDSGAAATRGRSGLTTTDRTGMTGADAGSTTMRGDLRAGARANAAPVSTGAVPLLRPGGVVERQRSMAGGAHPDSPFDSDETIGHDPL